MHTLRFVGFELGRFGGRRREEIRYALRLQGGVAEVRESGALSSGTSGFEQRGCVRRSVVSGGDVEVVKNGNVFHTQRRARRRIRSSRRMSSLYTAGATRRGM